MAKIGLFAGTVWRLFGWGLGGCFVGRLHVFAGAWAVNRFRTAHSDPPQITARQALVVWLSGLRGGVAFAIAGVLFKSRAFPGHCGGVTKRHSLAAQEGCLGAAVPNDGEAILQMTMLIAVFTTFCLGGAMPTIARRCGLIVEGDGSSHPAGSSHRPSPTTPGRLDNKAAPLLRNRVSSGGGRRVPLPEEISLGGGVGYASGSGASPTSLLGEPSLAERSLVEESHSWLVRVLTHEENYRWYLTTEREDETDRFIGRGSLVQHVLPPRSRAESFGSVFRERPSLRRWNSSGSVAPLSYVPPSEGTAAPGS